MESSKFWPKGGNPGILHHYTETLTAFEFTAGQARKPHSVLFVGGLGDGLATTSYIADLVIALETTEWSLFSLNLTSSYQAWGLGHLDRDTEEIAHCLRYIQAYKACKFGTGLTVLMGHSTGSQDVLHYLSSANPHPEPPLFDADLGCTVRPSVDGAIMQAPVSDRECIFWVLEHGWLGRSPSDTRKIYDEVVAVALGSVNRGGSLYDDILPLSLTSQIGYSATTPLSCRRFLSLVSPESPSAPREDDMFSSDLGDEQLRRTFGRISERGLLRRKLLVLSSGADQAIPKWVDKNSLLARWKEATEANTGKHVWDEHSGVIPHASHALSNDDQAEPRKDLNRRVLGFLSTLEQA